MSDFRIIEAVLKEDIKEVKKLLSERPKININIQDEEGSTALMYACEEGMEEYIKLLVEAGANLNLQDMYGETALRKVDNPISINIAQRITKYLIEKGADPHIKAKDGFSPLSADQYTEAAYIEYIMDKVKLLRSKKRLAFAKIMINDKDIPEDIVRKILEGLDEPVVANKKLLDKTDKMLNKILHEELQKELQVEIEKQIQIELKKKLSIKIYESIKDQFKGENIDDMIEFYRKLLRDPNLTQAQRRAYKRQKRTRKKKLGIKTGSSDLNTSELELKRAIEMSIKEAKSGSKKIKNKKKKKKSRKKSK
jgi:hypothetical protein